MDDAAFIPDVAEDQGFIPDDPPPGGPGAAQPNAGFIPDEVDNSGLKALVKDNIQKAKTEKATVDTSVKPVEAEDWLDSLAAGWGFSVAGLISSGENSPLTNGQHAGTVMAVASQVGMLAGDLPAMAAGSTLGSLVGAPIGGAAGTALGPVGTLGGVGIGSVGGAAAGAFMLPTAMRKVMMDHYERGDITTGAEFWNRLSSTTFETLKSGAVGLATAGAGGVVGPIAGNLAKTTAEIGAMVSVGKALEGELPNASDFINAGVVLGGLHVVGAIPRLREVYKKTGERPEAIVEKAGQDVILKQEILADNSKYNPKPEVKSAKEIERSSAEKAVLERVTTAAEKEKKSSGDIYTQMIDELHPIKEVGAGAYEAARLFRGWNGKLERVIKYETIDFHTEKANGEGLAPILKDIPNQDRAGFTAFAVSKRAIEKEAQGIKTGVPIEHAKEVVATGGHFEDTFRRLNEFQGRLLDYAVDAGLVAKEAKERMQGKNKDYVPFQRALEDAAADGGGNAKLFKEMKGSEKLILDPLGSVIKNSETLMRTAERNRALTEIVDSAELIGDELIKKSEGTKRSENTVSILREGERHTYEAKPELAAAMKALDYDAGSVALWFKIARVAARSLRAGVTLPLDFAVRNLFRDQLTASVQSKYGHVPFADVLSSLGSVFKKDAVWRDFLSSGGASGSFGEIARHLNMDAFGLYKETGVLDRAWNLVKTPVDGLRAVAEMSENVTRLSEYKRAIKAGADNRSAAFGAREVTVDFARIGAKVKAFNALIPFSNVGIQGLDRTIRAAKENPAAFTAKTVATITVPTLLNWWANKDDSRYKDAPNWEKDFFWLFPTDKWEPAASDGDAMARPEDLRRKRDGGGWEVNNGVVYKLPKPFEVGLLFGSLVERSLDTFYQDNPQAMEGLGSTMVNALVPNVLPAAAAPIFEQATNHSFFTGNPIVNASAQKLVPAYQYNEYTSETAKQLGKIIGHVPFIKDIGPEGTKLSSPMIIDNYIQMWTGAMGKYIVQLADVGFTAAFGSDKAPTPTGSIADVPFVKSFISRYPKATSQSVADFESDYSAAEKITNTVKVLMKRGDMESAKKLMEADPWAMAKITGIHKSIQSQRETIQKINADPAMSRDDKRQLIDTIYYQMSTMAHMGNKMAQEYKKQLGSIDKNVNESEN